MKVQIQNFCKITNKDAVITIDISKWPQTRITESPCQEFGDTFFLMCSCYKNLNTRETKRKIITTLCQTESKDAGKALRKIFEKETDVNDMLFIIMEIESAEIKEKERIELLYKALRKNMGDFSEDLAMMVSSALKKLDAIDEERLETIYTRGQEHEKVAVLIALAELKNINETGIKIIQKALKSQNQKVRKEAILCLSKIEHPDKNPLLKRLLTSGNPTIVWETATTLSSLKLDTNTNKEILDTVLETIETSVPIIASYACKALKATKTKEVIEFLREKLNELLSTDKNETTLTTALCEILGELQAEECIDDLIRVVKEHNQEVAKLTAIQQLSKFKDERIKQIMKELLEDQNNPIFPSIRVLASKYLSENQ